MNIEQLYSEVSELSPEDQLRLVEKVVHELIGTPKSEARLESESTELPKGGAIGLFADDSELLDRILAEALENRAVRPLRMMDRA